MYWTHSGYFFGQKMLYCYMLKTALVTVCCCCHNPTCDILWLTERPHLFDVRDRDSTVSDVLSEGPSVPGSAPLMSRPIASDSMIQHVSSRAVCCEFRHYMLWYICASISEAHFPDASLNLLWYKWLVVFALAQHGHLTFRIDSCLTLTQASLPVWDHDSVAESWARVRTSRLYVRPSTGDLLAL